MAAKFVLLVSLFVTFAYAKVLLAGGWNPINIEDKATRKVADFAANQIDMSSNSMWRSKLVKVSHAERQLVAGWRYKLTFDLGTTECMKSDKSKKPEECEVKEEKMLQECKVEVLVQAWNTDSPVELLNSTCTPKTQPKLQSLKMMPGGMQKADTNMKEIKEAAAFAVDAINAQSNAKYKSVLTEVLHATTQVTSGSTYRIELKMGSSKDNKIQHCKVVVSDQPWMKTRFTLHTWKCADSRSQRKQRSANFINGNVDAQMDMSAAGKPKPIHALDGFLIHGEPLHHKDQPILGGDDHDIGHYGDFLEFKKKYSKQYKDDQEEKMRFEIFHANMVKARDYERQDHGTAKYGATIFADITEEEFRKTRLNPVWDTSYDASLKRAQIPTDAPPTTWDWREHGAVTPVKNQGSCGSCWAFSVTGNVEGQWALKKKALVSLSEQELVDCDKVDLGCNGGLPSTAYKQIIKIGGLETEKEYPYKGVDSKCHFDKTEYKVYINSSVNISSNEADMAAWLFKNGPISIGINAFAMQFYMGGIAHPWSIFCNPKSLDHGVLIAGYGVKGGTPYWMVKNSWGKSWGVEGYYLVYRGAGVCGLNTMCTSAVVN